MFRVLIPMSVFNLVHFECWALPEVWVLFFLCLLLQESENNKEILQEKRWYAMWICKYLFVSYRVYIDWALRIRSGQGRRCLSGAEVRRQRQEHRLGCLDLLCLPACFVTVQYGGRDRDYTEPSSCFWDTLASGRVFDAEQHCFHCGPRGKHRTKTAFGRPALTCLFVMPPININASRNLFLFRPQILGIYLHMMIDYSYSPERTMTLK